MALLARGMVGDVAHRIDRLARRARRDHGALAGQWFSTGGARLQQRPRWRRRSLPASDMRPGPNSLQAMAPSLGPMKWIPRCFSVSTLATVAACGPHAHVHRGRRQHRLVGGEQHGRGEIVGHARRHARQDVGRGGRHPPAGRHRARAGCGPSRFRRSARTCRCRRASSVSACSDSGVTNLRAGLGEHATHRGTAFAQAAG